MLNQPVPYFELPSTGNKVFHLSAASGKNLVIYFYPKDNTPGCTTQACSFRDQYEDFKDLGAEVIGISSDSEKSHEQFSARYGLPFILLSDQDKSIRKLFGVSSDYLGLLPGRTTYVVDKSGIITYIFDSTSAANHIPNALAAIKKQI